MAKYDGVHTCGHEGIVDVWGRVKDRQWQIDKYFNDDCPDCKWEKREKEIEENTQVAKQRAKELDLPKLSGSERQINWALSIRDEFIEKGKKTERQINFYLILTGRDEEKDKEGNVLYTADSYHKSFLHLINKETSSIFWIDNRNQSPTEIIIENINNLPLE